MFIKLSSFIKITRKECTDDIENILHNHFLSSVDEVGLCEVDQERKVAHPRLITSTKFS